MVMMLRIQKERHAGGALFPNTREYSRYFGLNARRLALAKPDAIVMHPGPINRGVEIDPAVADGPRSVILDQVARGVAVRMAVLYLLAAAKPARACRRDHPAASRGLTTSGPALGAALRRSPPPSRTKR